MNSENSSFGESEGEDDYSPKQQNTRVSLRRRGEVNYKEQKYEEFDKELEEEVDYKSQRSRKSQNNLNKITQQETSDFEGDEEEYDPTEPKQGKVGHKIDGKEIDYGCSEIGGIFYPEIDQILFRRPKKDNEEEMEYMVKYKDWSYLHVDWLDEKEVVADSQPGKNKLNRFNKAFEKKIQDGIIDDEVIQNERYFDPSYVEVDRILHTTELFPVIHPKKANELKGKWNENLVLVVNKLLNFSKDTVHYGIHFQEPVNPERDGCPNYRRVISSPMDLGTLLNKLYLDTYKNPQSVWVDVGLVFKNCRRYNRDKESDLRILCDTLRECAVVLYNLWYQAQKKIYEGKIHDYKMKNDKEYLEKQLKIYEENFASQLMELSEETVNSIKKVIETFKNSKKDESMAFQEQLDEFLQIHIEKPEFKADCEEFRKIQESSESARNLTLNQFLKLLGFQVENQENEKMEEEEQDNNNNEKKGENGKEKENEENKKPLSKEEQKQEYEKKKNKYKTLVAQLNADQKSKLQQQLTTQYKTSLQAELQKFQAQGKKISQDEYVKLQGQIKGKIQMQQLEKIPELEEQIKANSTSTEKTEKKNGGMDSIEKFNPGKFSYSWLQEERQILIEDEFRDGYIFISENELKQLELSNPIDRLYLVKWKNLSYSESTWEQESLLGCPQRIYDFKMYNRALDKESRGIMMQNNNRHKTLLDLELNPKKKQKLGNAAINDIRNKLYFYDVASKGKKCKQYTPETQTIYKDRKLLRSYQLESLNWMIQSWYEKRNVILADEMGLGKTIQTMSFLNHLHLHENCRGPFLVIAPLSTLEHWKRTFDEWTNLNGVLYYDGNSQEGRSCLRYYEWFYNDISIKGTVLQTSEIYKCTVIITSNEVFIQDMQNVLMNIPFQFIVVDEAHRLKNQNAKILSTLKKMACKRVMLLTGTPIQNNTEELFTLLNYIEPVKFPSVEDFKKKFGELKTKEQVDHLQKMLKPYLLRRMKDDVEDSIPPLQETIIDIEMTNMQKALYRGLYEKNKAMLAKNFSSLATGTSLNNLEMQLRKCCSHPFLIKEIEHDIDRGCDTAEERYSQLINCSGKMILLDKLIQKFKKEGTKVLIFSQFTYILELIEEYLKYNRLKFEKIDGAVKARDRQNSIDRFNNPNKQRDVFLLSTKAGGLGINLTSASVVIIFDSDWNPQNDLQAIARAHRIGQTSEVMVYRFITRATYEAQMFERATIKLGLDQAIFLGGDFKSANKKDNSNQMDKKMNNKEVEMLLKKGILGFLDETNQQSKAFEEENIESILLNNTRKANFSLINSQYTFNKQAFVSKQTDADIDMDDPEFWNKVLKGRESQAALLKEEFDTNSKQIQESLEQQKQFICKLCELVNGLIESKLTNLNYSADDERNINDILNMIISTPKFNTKYQQLATNWLIECQRPSRRFKKMTLEELELQNISFSQNQLDKKGKRRNMGDMNFDEDDDEGLFQDDDDDFMYTNNNSSQPMAIQANASTNFKNVSGDKKLRASDDMLRKYCYYCERMNCTFICSGPCRRGFHENCKEEFERLGNWVNTNGPDIINMKLSEDGKTEDELRRLINKNANYVCTDCQKNTAVCHICKQKAPFFGNAKAKKKKKNTTSTQKLDEEDNQDDNNNNEDKGSVKKDVVAEDEQDDERSGKDRSILVKCSTANCNKFYHLECTDKFSLFKYIDPPANTRFRCSLHYCQKCSISGDSLTLSQCIRCNRSYHLKCFDDLDIVKLGKKVMICHLHDKRETQKQPQVKESIVNSSIMEVENEDDSDVIEKKNDAENEENEENQSENDKKSNQDFCDIDDDDDLDLGFVIKKKKKDKKVNEEKDGKDKEKEKEKDREREKDRDKHREKHEKKHKKIKDEKGSDKKISSSSIEFSSNSKRKTRNHQTKLDKYIDKSDEKKKYYDSDSGSSSEDNNEEREKKHKSKHSKSSSHKEKKKDKKGSSSTSNLSNLDKNNLPKFSYKDLGMPAPKDFDYESYNQDWCRYCGARFSSNFTKGPWGSRTLCTVHYINWMQKKKLNLSAYKELPTKPINPEDLNELMYISREKTKNPEFNPGEILNNLVVQSLVEKEQMELEGDEQEEIEEGQGDQNEENQQKSQEQTEKTEENNNNNVSEENGKQEEKGEDKEKEKEEN